MTCTEPLFRTPLPQERAPFTLDYSGGVVMLGSCFTTEVGELLARAGVKCEVNPCGVMYNPASIAMLLECAMGEGLREEYFFEHDGRWRCWLMPTRFARPTVEECRRGCGQALATLRSALAEASTLIITLGTARVYTHTGLGYRGIVGNCHKVPAARFDCRRLTAAEIMELWQPLLRRLARFNPGLRVIYTVSPIRHFKDGARENTLSKATLHIATAALTEDSPLESDYFPAWELLMDELRDYRFYAADMLHPSPVAVEYIYRRFAARYYSEDARRLMAEAEARARREAHRTIMGSRI